METTNQMRDGARDTRKTSPDTVLKEDLGSCTQRPGQGFRRKTEQRETKARWYRTAWDIKASIGGMWNIENLDSTTRTFDIKQLLGGEPKLAFETYKEFSPFCFMWMKGSVFGSRAAMQNWLKELYRCHFGL